MNLYYELSAAVLGGVGELRLVLVLDTASPLLPSCTSAAVLLSIVRLKSSTTSACNAPTPIPLYVSVDLDGLSVCLCPTPALPSQSKHAKKYPKLCI